MAILPASAGQFLAILIWTAAMPCSFSLVDVDHTAFRAMAESQVTTGMPASMASLPVGTRASAVIGGDRQAVDFLGNQRVDQLDLLGSIGGSGTLVEHRHAQFLGGFLGAVVGGVEVGVAQVLGDQHDRSCAPQPALAASVVCGRLAASASWVAAGSLGGAGCHRRSAAGQRDNARLKRTTIRCFIFILLKFEVVQI